MPSLRLFDILWCILRIRIVNVLGATCPLKLRILIKILKLRSFSLVPLTTLIDRFLRLVIVQASLNLTKRTLGYTKVVIISRRITFRQQGSTQPPLRKNSSPKKTSAKLTAIAIIRKVIMLMSVPTSSQKTSIGLGDLYVNN